MNEMNASERILEQACAEAGRTGARVASMQVAVGSLSGIHQPSLLAWLHELSRGTAAEGCRIELLADEPLARCHDCQRIFSPDADGPACPCGGLSFTLISGQEAYLEGFTLEHAAEPPLGFGPADPDGTGMSTAPVDG